MTEFSYYYDKDPLKLICSASPLNSFDLICFDCSGLTIKQQKLIYNDAACYLKEKAASSLGGTLMLWHEDTLAFTRFLFSQVNDPAGLLKLKLAYTMHIMCGPIIPIAGGAVNAQLCSPIQRVVSVFYTSPEKMLFNLTGNKNTLIEGDRNIGFSGNPRKCIGGDVFAKILYQFKYDEFKSVFIGNFERPMLTEFVKFEPRRPTERFKFSVVVGESNIRSIDSARMDCAVNDVSCDFSNCPSPAETTKMMKEVSV